MGLFDFFKKPKREIAKGYHKSGKNISNDEAQLLIMAALNVLCDDISTVEDARKMLASKGCNEQQCDAIANRANELYIKHFKGNDKK
jgi:hypothetical protein